MEHASDGLSTFATVEADFRLHLLRVYDINHLVNFGNHVN
jgi:hypothetical protein